MIDVGEKKISMEVRRKKLGSAVVETNPIILVNLVNYKGNADADLH